MELESFPQGIHPYPNDGDECPRDATRCFIESEQPAVLTIGSKAGKAQRAAGRCSPRNSHFLHAHIQVSSITCCRIFQKLPSLSVPSQASVSHIPFSVTGCSPSVDGIGSLGSMLQDPSWEGTARSKHG